MGFEGACCLALLGKRPTWNAPRLRVHERAWARARACTCTCTCTHLTRAPTRTRAHTDAHVPADAGTLACMGRTCGRHGLLFRVSFSGARSGMTGWTHV